MPETLDYTKAYADLYLPKRKPVLVTVPPMRFIAVDGSGAPESPAYQNAIGVLYAVSYTIKMSPRSGPEPSGYYAYKVPPLEGLWWGMAADRNAWEWTAMVRLPDFATEELLQQTIKTAAAKKPALDFSHACHKLLDEGDCIQMMHVGPFSEEAASFAVMEKAMAEQGLVRRHDVAGPGGHHEIYLSDTRRCAPEKLRTVLRIPVQKP